MYKVLRSIKPLIGEQTPSCEKVAVENQATGEIVFEVDSDSYYVLDGKLVQVSTISDLELLTDLVRRGRLQ